MPVCRYFQQGTCRYGDKCWYEHPSGGNQGFRVTAQKQLFGKKSGGQNVTFRDSFGQNQNPYKWSAQDNQTKNTSAASTQKMSASDVVKELASEISDAWEGGKIWPFSCLAFEKDMPSLPGFNDISPEELRLEAYDAIKQGNTQAYTQKVETAFNQVNTQRQELKNPNLTVKQKLISFIEDCRRNQSSGNAHVTLFSDSSSNTFGCSSGLFGASTSSQPSTGLFGASTSTQSNSGLFGSTSGNQPNAGLFGKQPEQSGTQSVFGQTSSQASAFGQTGTQSLFGKSTFGQTEQSNNLFGQNSFGQAPSTGQTGLFGQQSTSGSTFGQAAPSSSQQSLFGSPVSSPFSDGNTGQATPSTPFGQSTIQPKSLFGSPATTVAAVAPTTSQIAPAQASSNQSDQSSTLYTPLDKISPQDLEQFKAPTFTLGSIPTTPPPKELCFG
ncbi:Nucleoporin-like protein 2 [Mactra antiquata]